MNAITLYARQRDGYEQRVSQSVALLREAATAHAGTIVQATSLGAEDIVVTDLITRHALPIAVATLDTGALHAESLALIERIEEHFNLRVERWQPVQQHVVHFVQQHGPKAMYDSLALRKACCAVRKLETLARLLHGRSAWVTGLRQEQSAARAEVPWVDHSEPARTKFNPLAHWSWQDVWHHIASHGLPYNALHDQFYPSIGCAPCTRAVALGEDFRAGRWWWENESAKECGLHVNNNAEPVNA
jgi:phosphoadenosine phosphosulfate reductase